MSDRSSEQYFLIDGPSPFAPIAELLAFRDECQAMLTEFPNHPQWLDELKRVTTTIEERRDGKT